MSKIKFLVMDVDGTLTDGKIYMGNNGEVMKAFSIKDGYAISILLPKYKVIPVVITARNSRIVENRCEELNINILRQGRKDKLKCILEVLKDCMGKNITEQNLDCVAYIGDDLLDLQCIESIKRNGGYSACPIDAARDVKKNVDYISPNKGGEGAVRDYVEWLIQEGILE